MVGGEEVGGRLQESLGRRGGHHDVAPQQLLLLGERLEGGQPGQTLEAGGGRGSPGGPWGGAGRRPAPGRLRCDHDPAEDSLDAEDPAAAPFS